MRLLFRTLLLSTILVMASVWLQSGYAAEETNSSNRSMVVDILPASMHANFKADNFWVRGPNGKEVMSIFSSYPSVDTGITWQKLSGYLDLKAGAGMLLNYRMGVFSAYGLAGWYQEVRPGVLFGPHGSLSYFFKPEWWGDTDIDFDNSLGWSLGFHVAAGDRLTYVLSVDYTSVAFDIARHGEGITHSDDKLDMSGVSVGFGIRVEL